jgi:hypothetical protein
MTPSAAADNSGTNGGVLVSGADCLNLRELFGGRFVVRFDPGYDPTRRPSDKLDPWSMTLGSRFATIYPHGRHLLAVEVDGHPSVRKRLDSLDCCRRYLAGERFGCWLFHHRDFERVAQIVRPARKRSWTEADRRKSADRLTENLNRRLVGRIDSPISRAVCEVRGPRDSEGILGGSNASAGQPRV